MKKRFLLPFKFLLHQHQTRRCQERSVDTYVTAPFRSIDFQLQGMTETGEKTYGAQDEWSLVTKRVQDIPRFLTVARELRVSGARPRPVHEARDDPSGLFPRRVVARVG